jgi:hypothetical protein
MHVGLSLEFYAGDASIIGDAFTEVELDELRDGTKAATYADLSLHITTLDLDILSDVVARHLDIKPTRLSKSLVEQVGFLDDGETGGAILVARGWVEMMALLNEKDAGLLANNWMAQVDEESGASWEVSEHSAQALASLIRLCKKAIDDGLDVVHVWYL